MLEESIRLLEPKPGRLYVDGTLGGGGHADRILEESAPDGRLIGFDRDKDALEAAGKRLEKYGSRLTLVHGNYASMAEVAARMGISGIDGLILDLGVSSHQLDTGSRGFSFQVDAPLDMRMDTAGGETAAALIARLEEQELERIIKEFGEERWARKIAAAIVRARVSSEITTTLQLADIVRGAIPRKFWEERIHPATRTFQALRIAVNDELASLREGLEAVCQLIKPGGRVVVISFHSLEDRIVKNFFRSRAGGCTCPRELPICVCNARADLRILTGKAIVAGEREVAGNPRARSARLRGAEKV